MAKYRRPIFPSTFETASTVPTAASFQEVPPPSTGTGGSRKAIPIPAMAPVEPDVVVKPKEKGKEVIVEGIVIPPKPIPPKDDDCCMSGCVNCVYNLYADDLELYTQSLKEAHQALTKSSVPKSEWPDAVKKLDGNKSGGEEGIQEEMEKVEEGIDPVTMAFLEMERKLKKKQVAKGA